MPGPPAGAERQTPVADILQPPGDTRPSHVGFRTLLATLPDPLVGGEFSRVERRRHVSAVTPAAADFAVHARADLEPRRWNDHRVDEWPLDAVVDRRLVPFVDDANRHQHHARAHVERAIEQKVHVGLFELEFARILEALDERVFEFQLANESNARRETCA